MAKLTAEQKAANKAAQKVRGKAFTARLRAYNAALTAATEQAAASEFRKQIDVAEADWDREMKNRDDAISAVEQQIYELEERRGRLKAQYELSLRPKKEARDRAWRALRAHETALTELVHKQFPDIAGVWYVSQWKVPPEVQAQMDAAKKAQ